MPETSPLMSARNTGTPFAESCSAMSCSDFVFPVPVAPAMSPCRFTIASGMPTSGSPAHWPSCTTAPSVIALFPDGNAARAASSTALSIAIDDSPGSDARGMRPAARRSPRCQDAKLAAVPGVNKAARSMCQSALSLLNPEQGAESIVARIGLEARHEISVELRHERALLHGPIEPRERLVVLAECRVDDRDVHCAPVVARCLIEQRRENAPRLVDAPRASEHEGEQWKAASACDAQIPLRFRDRLRPHALSHVALRRDRRRPQERWTERSQRRELRQGFVAAVACEQCVRDLGAGGRGERIE